MSWNNPTTHRKESDKLGCITFMRSRDTKTSQKRKRERLDRKRYRRLLKRREKMMLVVTGDGI